MKVFLLSLLAASSLMTASLALAQQPPAGGGNAPRMTPEERFKAADKNNDGKISKAEAKDGLGRMADRFDEIDTNKDGSISLDELKNAPRPQGGAGGGQPPAK